MILTVTHGVGGIPRHPARVTLILSRRRYSACCHYTIKIDYISTLLINMLCQNMTAASVYDTGIFHIWQVVQCQ